MVIDILLVLWFSVSPCTLLLLYAIVCMLVYESLRDILYSRMKGFTQVLFFDILSDTLVLYRSQLGES